MLLQLFHFFSLLYSPPIYTPLPPSFPHLSSCPWVIHLSSLASPFYIQFLTTPISILYLPFMLLPCTFSPFSDLPSSSLLITLHFCDLYFCESVPVLVVCFICQFYLLSCQFFFFFLGLVVDCEFVVILPLIFFIFFP